MKGEGQKEKNLKVRKYLITSLHIEKATAASFGGIEALSFNLSSKVKMLRLTHFF